MCLAYPMKVIELKGKKAIAQTPGIRKEINIGLLQNVIIGDYVMVHAGFAIEKVDEKEARETLKVFKEYERAWRKSSKE